MPRAAAARAALAWLGCLLAWSAPAVAEDVGSTEAAADDDAVLTLTKDNFDETLKRHDRVLVEFYAPWCGHCKALEPEYKKAAKEMQEEKLTSMLAKVDATQEPDLAKNYEVSGYPTLLYFAKGAEAKKYDGGRTADAIKAWLRKRELPMAKKLEEGQVEEFLKGTPAGEFALVARVVPQSARAKAYLAALEAHLMDYQDAKMTFGIVHLPKGANSKDAASLTMWRPGFEAPDTESLTYTGKWSETAIAKWAKTSSYPLVGGTFEAARYSAESAKNLGKDGVVVVLLGEGADDASRAQVRAELRTLAAGESKWLFTATPMDHVSVSVPVLEGLGLGPNSKESAVVVYQDKRKFLLTGGQDVVAAPGAVKAHLEAVKAKKAKPYYKSATPPEGDIDEEGVTVLTGKTFQKYVLDSKKDVFVEFYAPWCGHCKKLAPEWARLARKVKDAGWATKGVVVAKMDSTENECDEEVTGYPTLILYPAVKAERKFKQKQLYGGARDFEPLLDFLLENAKNLDGVEDTGTGAEKKKKYSMVDRERQRKKKTGGEL